MIQLRLVENDERDTLYSQDSGGEPPMDRHFEKYLDIRFGHIEGDIKAIRSDIKDQTKKIDNLKYWILGTFLGLATLFFTVVGYYTWTVQNQFNYHQSAIQAQMQSFSEYVKAVTQPHPPNSSTPPK